MYYTIYKITNRKNGKIYIGKHQTNDLNDGYFGSGVALVQALKKYGKDSFEKEILFIFDNVHEMNNKEKEIITEEFVARRDTYNLGIGGEGGPHFKGHKHTTETKKKLSNLHINRAPLSQEARQKISEANKRRIISKDTGKKIAIKAYMRNGKSLEEATYAWLCKEKKKNTIKRTKSQAQTAYMSNIENRKKLSEKMKKLHLKFDFDAIKKDLELGMKPKKIREKYGMSKNTYDHMIPKYIKPLIDNI